MAWLLAYDITTKHSFNYQKYTEWGELSTFFVFGLLALCSIQKLYQEKAIKNGEKISLQQNWLYKWTAVAF